MRMPSDHAKAGAGQILFVEIEALKAPARGSAGVRVRGCQLMRGNVAGSGVRSSRTPSSPLPKSVFWNLSLLVFSIA